MTGEKKTPFVIGKSQNPRDFKNLKTPNYPKIFPHLKIRKNDDFSIISKIIIKLPDPL